MAKRKAPTGPPEKQVLRDCLAWLALWPQVRAWRNNSGLAMLPGRGGKPQPVRFGQVGAPDILGYVTWHGHAITLGIECKGPRGRLRPEQAAWLARLRDDGGIALCVRSLEELIVGLRPWGVGS